jgi:hypothetical protein
MQFTTLNTITFDLLDIIRRSNIADTEQISKRRLEDKVHQVRAMLIKRDLDKSKKPNPDYIQEIGNLRLESVDLSGDDLTSLGLPSGSYIYRTTLELPRTLDLNHNSGFTYIGTPVGDEIQFIPEGRSKWQRYKKYTANDKLVFLRGGYLYVVSSRALEFITVRGIFEIPTEVGRFVNPITDQPYFGYDTKYPIPINMLQELKGIILQSEFKIELTLPTDVTNDSANNPQRQQ